MTEWTPRLRAFVEECDEETWIALRDQVLDADTVLTAAGRGVYERMNWRKIPRLAVKSEPTPKGRRLCATLA